VEQSELWVYKKKEAKEADEAETKGSKAAARGTEARPEVGDRFVLAELDEGPELEAAAVAKYKELYQILYSLIGLCVAEAGGKRRPRRNDQRLLRNMGVHNIVLDLTKISYERAEDRRMRVIMRTAHEFLQAFCFGNAHNQALLHEKLDLSHYPQNEWEATTATHIFRDNAPLCNEISERLVQNFVHALEQQHAPDESKVAYLEFLQTICIVDGHEAKKCQDMIIAELVNSDVMSFSSDKTYIDELCALMQREQEPATRRLVLFHTNLIKVLINCTVGKNTFTEIKCHTVLSLDDIDKVVTHRHCLTHVKDTYVHFLYHCHVDTENETKEIFTQPYIWSIFDNFVQDMSLVAPARLEPDHADRELEAYVAERVVEVVAGFFSHTQFAQIPSPHLRAPAFKGLYAKMVQLYHAAWLTDQQRSNVAMALSAMQDKASFLGRPP